MTASKLFLALKINILAGWKRNLVYILLYFLSALFLITVATFGTKILWGLDHYINQSAEMDSYRQFEIECDERQSEELLKLLAAKGNMIKSAEEGVYMVSINDYRQKDRLIKQIEDKNIGTPVLDTQIEINLQIFKNLRKGIVLSFGAAISGMLLILNINIRQTIQERYYEIGICYAVGYTPKQIALTFWSEIVTLLLIGILLAYGMVSLLQHHIKVFFLKLTEIEPVNLYHIQTGQQLNLVIIATIVFIACLEMRNVQRHIVKLNPLELLNMLL